MEGELKSIPAKFRKLISKHPSLEIISEGEKSKVKCTLSGHEMPCQEEAVLSYINGKKYKRLSEQHEFNYDQYKPHIVPSTKKWGIIRKQLFCMLTLRHLNRDPAHVLRHVQGRRFKRALAKWEECQKTGETFKPRGGSQNIKVSQSSDSEVEDSRKGKKKKKSTGKGSATGEDEGWKMMDEEDDDGEDSDADSLSDLYPAADFASSSSSSAGEESDECAAELGEDSEFEDDDVIPAPPQPANKGKNQKSRKRTSQGVRVASSQPAEKVKRVKKPPVGHKKKQRGVKKKTLSS